MAGVHSMHLFRINENHLCNKPNHFYLWLLYAANMHVKFIQPCLRLPSAQLLHQLHQHVGLGVCVRYLLTVPNRQSIDVHGPPHQ